MERYERSDLAMECEGADGGNGVRLQRSAVGGCDIVRVHICTPEAAARLRKPVGRYITVDGGGLCEMDVDALERMRCALAVELRDLAERMSGKRIGKGFSVLVVGLGNREITPDAVGPETVHRLSVTRHLRQEDNALYSTVGLCEISALTPGVTGQTGMEAVELVRGAVGAVSPDLVIAVDALAARDIKRLAATVQLSDAGICPGSGLGNRRRALNAETVGAPVMALGVSTVVESAALACDLLRRAGVTEPDDAIRQALETGRDFFVAPKEIDLQVAIAATLLSGAIEKAFCVDTGLLL